MNLGESSEEGIFSRITLEFDTHLVSLKPQALRHEISDEGNIIKLSSSDKELKKSPIQKSLATTLHYDLSTISGIFLNAQFAQHGESTLPNICTSIL